MAKCMVTNQFNSTCCVILHAFCHLLMFSNNFFPINSFRNIISMNILDLAQDRHYVMPDLGPNCQQRSAEDNKRRHLQVKSYCL